MLLRAPLALLIAVLTVCALWVVISNLTMCFRAPVQLIYIEGFLADDAARLAAGGPLYSPLTEPPYSVMNFTPLSLAAAAALIKAGCAPLAAGRLVTILASMALALIIAVWGFAGARWTAVVTGLLLLLDPLFWPLGLAMRPDLPAACLGIAAVALATSRGTSRMSIPALVLVLACFYTKQSSVAAGGSICLYLLFTNRRLALRYGAAFVATGLGIAALLQLASNGQFFFHTVTANANPFFWRQMGHFAGRFASQHPVELILVAVLLGRQLRARRLTLPATYVLCSLLLTVSTGKQGAHMQYFIEPLGAMYLLATHELEWRKVRDRLASRPLLVVVVCAATAALAILHVRGQVAPRTAAMQAVPFHHQLTRLVAQEQGIVVADDASLLIAAHKPVYYRPYVMAMIARAGRWDPTPMLQDLASGRISLVIARTQPEVIFQDRYTPGMRAIIAEHFRVRTRFQLGALYTVFAFDQAKARTHDTVTPNDPDRTPPSRPDPADPTPD